ncbi:hypothetical protein GCM10023174_25010 [Chelativorans composti]|uniref:Uncharacterized protein n=1 Tax=Chelativorans composti TaxID=768533 RepID=A0ABW5DL22_9HYPH
MKLISQVSKHHTKTVLDNKIVVNAINDTEYEILIKGVSPGDHKLAIKAKDVSHDAVNVEFSGTVEMHSYRELNVKPGTASGNLFDGKTTPDGKPSVDFDNGAELVILRNGERISVQHDEVLRGKYGELKLGPTGDYQYTTNGDAKSIGKVDIFDVGVWQPGMAEPKYSKARFRIGAQDFNLLWPSDLDKDAETLRSGVIKGVAKVLKSANAEYRSIADLKEIEWHEMSNGKRIGATDHFDFVIEDKGITDKDASVILIQLSGTHPEEVKFSLKRDGKEIFNKEIASDSGYIRYHNDCVWVVYPRPVPGKHTLNLDATKVKVPSGKVIASGTLYIFRADAESAHTLGEEPFKTVLGAVEAPSTKYTTYEAGTSQEEIDNVIRTGTTIPAKGGYVRMTFLGDKTTAEFHTMSDTEDEAHVFFRATAPNGAEALTTMSVRSEVQHLGPWEAMQAQMSKVIYGDDGDCCSDPFNFRDKNGQLIILDGEADQASSKYAADVESDAASNDGKASEAGLADIPTLESANIPTLQQANALAAADAGKGAPPAGLPSKILLESAGATAGTPGSKENLASMLKNGTADALSTFMQKQTDSQAIDDMRVVPVTNISSEISSNTLNEEIQTSYAI